MNKEKQNLSESNIGEKDVIEESKENKSDEITILGDNTLCESVVGGDMPDHRPMPLYGIRPRPMLKYGVEKPNEPVKPKEEKDPEGDKKENEKCSEIKPLDS